MTQKLRIFLIAGEPSGDRLGASLMAGIKELAQGEVIFEGVGGPLMQSQGLSSLFEMSELSVMGLVEVLPRLPNLLRRIRQTSVAAIAFKPDGVVTIDSPDFCLRVVRKAKEELPLAKFVHYVAPSVWAWRPDRATKMASHINHVLALLPFEPPYMRQAGMSCDFVGHPVASEPLATAREVAHLRSELGLGEHRGPIITLLPGSREGEINRMSGVFAKTQAGILDKFPKTEFILPAASNVANLIREKVKTWPKAPHVLDPRKATAGQSEQKKRAAFAASDLALATSGTVSLELAAAGCPMVIAYRANWLTTLIIKRKILIDTGTLVSLITDTRVIPEFMLDKCHPDAIAKAMIGLLQNPEKLEQQKEICRQALTTLGRGNPKARLWAARSILNALDRSDNSGPIGKTANPS